MFGADEGDKPRSRARAERGFAATGKATVAPRACGAERLIALAVLLLGCRGATTPVSGASDSRLPGRRPRRRRECRRRGRRTRRARTSPRRRRSGPHPELPPDRRALLVIGPAGSRRGALGRRRRRGGGGIHAARSFGRLDAVHLRRSRCRRRGSRCPIGTGASSSGWRTTSSTRTASRWSPAPRITSSSTASRPRWACCVRASSRTNSTPATIRRARTRSTRSRPSPTSRPPTSRRTTRRLAKIREEVEKARKKAHLATLDELAEKQPAFAPKVKMLARRAAEKPAMAAVERRLTCEGLLGGKRKHTEGIYDDAMRLAVRQFQQKHMIYEANYLRRKTVDALARPLIDNDYDDLTRALRERVVAAAAILEDGSVKKSRNLVDEYLKTALRSAAVHRRGSRAGVLQAPSRRRVQAPARRDQAAAAPRLLLRQHGPLDRRRSRRRLVRPAVRRQGPLQAAAAQEVPAASRCTRRWAAS